MTTTTHSTIQTIEPSILYLGTPVVLISTVNDDGTYNLAPMSSAFWLGWRCILGLDATSKTTENMLRTGECVLNLPSANQVVSVDGLAMLTGSDTVPQGKQKRGYRIEKDKFGRAGMNPVPSDIVAVPRALECPIQLEAKVEHVRNLAEDNEQLRGGIKIVELRILRVHADKAILIENRPDHIDPKKWRPLIMSFQKFYGLSDEEAGDSALAQIPESAYRSPEVDKAHSELAAKELQSP